MDDGECVHRSHVDTERAVQVEIAGWHGRASTPVAGGHGFPRSRRGLVAHLFSAPISRRAESGSQLERLPGFHAGSRPAGIRGQVQFL